MSNYASPYASTLLLLTRARDAYAASNVITAFDACKRVTCSTNALTDLLNALLAPLDSASTHEVYGIAYGTTDNSRDDILNIFEAAIAEQSDIIFPPSNDA